MNCIAFIPLRKGSKSIPNKNRNPFAGKPLYQWVLEAALNARHINQVVIATDDAAIIESLAQSPHTKLTVYHRQPENASDTASTESVMIEYLKVTAHNPTDTFVLIQATSPLTTPTQLDAAINQFNATPSAKALITGTRLKRFLWNDSGTPMNYNYAHRPRRQDFKGTFMENGAFYISRIADILASQNRLTPPILLFEMPDYAATELDDPEDWRKMEAMVQSNVATPNDASTPRKSAGQSP